MLAIPFTLPPGPERARGPVVLVLILEKENLDRMRQGDPFDLQCRVYGQHGLDADRPIRDLDIVIAYEEDRATMMAFKEKNDIAGLLAWIERGRMHRFGDAAPPVPLRKK